MGLKSLAVLDLRECVPTTLSERSVTDSQAAMGYGTTRSLDRLLSSCGLLSAAPLEFGCADDVPNGGVLCALGENRSLWSPSRSIPG